MTTNVRDVFTSDFPDQVLARSGHVPVVVDFWAAWCGPCRVLGPILERAAGEAGGEWELVKVDVDQNQQLAAEYGVQGIPTVIGFRDGQAAARFTGALPEASVRQWLRELVPSRADRLATAGAVAVDAGDTDQAETAFREALVEDGSHVGAALGLGRILLDRGEASPALEVMSPLPETEEVQGLRSQARILESGLDTAALRGRVQTDPTDWQARLDLGRSLAAEGEYGQALDHLQQVVEAGGELSDEARLAMLDLFNVVADGDLVAAYRRRLANALF